MGGFFAKTKTSDSHDALEAAADAFVAKQQNTNNTITSTTPTITITPRTYDSIKTAAQSNFGSFASTTSAGSNKHTTPPSTSPAIGGKNSPNFQSPRQSISPIPSSSSAPLSPLSPNASTATTTTTTPQSNNITIVNHSLTEGVVSPSISNATTSTTVVTPQISTPKNIVFTSGGAAFVNPNAPNINIEQPNSSRSTMSNNSQTHCNNINSENKINPSSSLTPPKHISIAKHPINLNNEDDTLADDEPLPRADSMLLLRSNSTSKFPETLLTSPTLKYHIQQNLNPKKILPSIQKTKIIFEKGKVKQINGNHIEVISQNCDVSPPQKILPTNEKKNNVRHRSSSWLLENSPTSNESEKKSNPEKEKKHSENSEDSESEKERDKDTATNCTETNTEHFSPTLMNSDREFLNDGYYTLKESEAYEIDIDSGDNLEIPDQIQWKRGLPIGSGAFGTVYSGLNINTGEMLAVKICPVAKNATKQVEEFYKEVAVLRLLKHENIVRFMGASVRDDNLFIFLEYIPSGSISSLLLKFGPFSESVVKLYTRQILEGLLYLHNCKIFHRDIKGANILVDSNGIVKLTDFGSSNLLKFGEGNDLRTSLKGTPNWMAPEVVRQTGAGRKADIWSVGCTVVEMATGKPLWSEFTNQVLRKMFYF